MLPGRTLHRLACRLCSAKSLDRVIEPAIADLQKEYADASRGALRRRWLLLVGYLAVWRVLVVSISGTFASMNEDKDVLIRALSLAGMSMVAVTVLLMIPPLTAWREFVSPIHFALTVPQAVPLAIPIGLVIGLAFGAGGRAVSSATTRAILLVAVLSSIVSFATMAWLMPAANQEFRQQIFAAMGNRGTVMKGYSEMTFQELDAEIATAKAVGSDRGARRVAWHYHLKASLASAPFALALFALAPARRWRKALPLAFILLSPVGYWLLMWLGQWLGISTSTPPSVGAWLPNIVLATIALLITSSRSAPVRVSG